MNRSNPNPRISLWTASLAAAVALALLSGCGGGDSSNDREPEAKPDPEVRLQWTVRLATDSARSASPGGLGAIVAIHGDWTAIDDGAGTIWTLRSIPGAIRPANDDAWRLEALRFGRSAEP